MTRESLMAKAVKLQKRAIEFDKRARQPRKYFAPVMFCERDHAKRALDAVILEIVTRFPGKWSEAEQELMRPL